MNIPAFSKNGRLTAVTPALNGGLDVNRAPWLIGDNQLSDCRNLWWKDGALRSRDGFFTTPEDGYAYNGQTCRFAVDREGWILMAEQADTQMTVYAFSPDGGGRQTLWSDKVAAGTTFCLVPAGGTLDQHTLLLYLSDGRLVAFHPSEGTALAMATGFYEPLLMVNGRPVVKGEKETVTGILYEPRNRLNTRFRCDFTSDGVGVHYYLPVKNLTGNLHIQVKTSETTIEGYLVEEGQYDSGDGEYNVRVNRQEGCISFTHNGSLRTLEDTGLRNNVRIWASTVLEGPSPFDMTFGTWYGGESSGTAGGTRLFLAGNAAHPDAVVYSAVNNPLYFPESSWTAVGTPDQPVTALGKQEKYLVLFKERELYLAEYRQGDTVTGDDLQSGEVTDMAAAAASFPLTPLSVEIGCDSPRTLALLDNRLVWANTDGAVYRLSALNTTYNRTVTRMGDSIHPLLKGETPLSACVYDDRYYLLCDRTLWVLADHDTLSWYRFEWHDNAMGPHTLCRRGDRLAVIADGGGKQQWFTLTGQTDVFPLESYGTRPVSGMLCTKSYDFGTPETEKQVLGVAAEVGGTVTPSYVTERGERQDRPHRPDNGGLVRCSPHVARCRRLALRLTGDTMTVGSVILQLRGGMR